MSEEPVAEWRLRIRKAHHRMTDEEKQIFLSKYRQFGRKGEAAHEAGVCRMTIENMCKTDQEFADAVQEAWKDYGEHIHQVAYEQAARGVEEVFIGGKERDKLVVHDGKIVTKKIFPNNPILQMELKRTNEEYRERSQVDMNITGGVLVAPPQVTTEEWIQEHAKKPPDSNAG